MMIHISWRWASRSFKVDGKFANGDAEFRLIRHLMNGIVVVRGEKNVVFTGDTADVADNVPVARDFHVLLHLFRNALKEFLLHSRLEDIEVDAEPRLHEAH